MPTTDVWESGFEALIVRSLVDEAGYVLGDAKDYDREHALDWHKLLGFLRATQPKAVAALELETDSPKRTRFLARLTGEIARRGVVDVLRKGVADGPVHVELFYGTPHPDNAQAVERFGRNVFSVVRQLRYSRDDANNALDCALFVNGLPVATFELKNRLTGQTVEDAVQQYKNDRDPRERVFCRSGSRAPALSRRRGGDSNPR